MKKKANPFTFSIILFLIIFSSHFSCLSAQNEIPDSLVVERLQFIKNTLKQDQINTRRWWYGWLGTYGAATIGQGVVYFSSHEKGMRQDMALGAATTLLGVAGQFISPLVPGNEPEQFNSLPANTPDERSKKLTFAEKLLADCAHREKLARSWKNHAMCSAVNLGGGLITWLGFKRSIGAGIGYFVLNTAITETQIWTQPTLARRNYRKYLQKFPENEPDVAFVPDTKFFFEAYPGGFGIKVVF
jgi:hypothetical protein